MLPVPAFVPFPVWISSPAYVVPPPGNVIFSNIHNTTIINNNGPVINPGSAKASPARVCRRRQALELAWRRRRSPRKSPCLHPWPGRRQRLEAVIRDFPAENPRPARARGAPLASRDHCRQRGLPPGHALPGATGKPLPGPAKSPVRASPAKAPTGIAGRASEPAGRTIAEQAARGSCLAKRPAASPIARRACRARRRQAWPDFAAWRASACGTATPEKTARRPGFPRQMDALPQGRTANPRFPGLVTAIGAETATAAAASAAIATAAPAAAGLSAAAAPPPHFSSSRSKNSSSSRTRSRSSRHPPQPHPPPPQQPPPQQQQQKPNLRPAWLAALPLMDCEPD